VRVLVTVLERDKQEKTPSESSAEVYALLLHSNSITAPSLLHHCFIIAP
jgi:hypothetical protein